MLRPLFYCPLALAVLLLGPVGCQREPALVVPPGYEEARAALLLNGDFRHYPAIDPTGRWLVFVRNNRSGVEYGLMDLRDRSVQTLVTNAPGNYQDTLADLYAWSPDGRWLAWVEPAEWGESWTVRLQDMERGTVANTGLKLTLQDLVWVGSECFGVRYGEYFLLVEYRDGQWKANYSRRYNLTAEANKLPPKDNQAVRKVELDWKTLTPSGPQRVAYSLGGNLWELDLETGLASRLTDWGTGKLKWLEYSTENQAFLFCAPNPDDQGRLTLMTWQRGDGATAAPRCLTPATENALKGRWLGAGHVYVSDRPDRSQLVVAQPAQPARTLFPDGSVWSYDLGAGGRQIAAIASEQMEPMGLWVADPSSGQTHRVLAQENYSPRVDRCAVTNTSGQRVEYTVFRPADLHPAKPFPVLFVTAYGRTWAELSRVLPRLNMVQVMPAVGNNMRGATEPQNLSAVWQEVAKIYPVDTNRVYLEGLSAVTASLAGIVEANPGLFRGLIIDSPGGVGGLPDPDLLLRDNLPVLLTIGTEDKLHAETKRYAATLRRRGVLVWWVEISGMGHEVRSSDHFERRVRATVSFIHRSAPAKP